MSVRRPSVVRRHPFLVSMLALAGTAVAAAAGIRAYQVFHFTGTMVLDDGSTAQVEGDIEVHGEGEQSTMSVTAQVPDGAASGGEMNITLPDGKTARVVAVPANGQKPAASPARAK